MSDPVRGNEREAVPSPTVPDEKRRVVEQVLTDILRRMDLPARLELRDGTDGGISVALYPEVDLPGVQTGRRSHLVDSLQLITNKIVNRTPAERRWVSIGVGGHPAPRASGERVEKRAKAESVAPVAAVAPQAVVSRPQKPPSPQSGAGVQAAMAATAVVADTSERLLDVPEDAQLAQVIRHLTEKSARLGRFYAVIGMKREDRARVLKAAEGASGVTVSAEGEGRQRRLVFKPDKPAPMPCRVMPDDDEDFEDA